MYIGKRRFATSEYYELYLDAQLQKTLTIARTLSLFGLPSLIYYLYQDIYIIDLPGLFLARLILIVPFFFYVINTFIVKNQKRQVVEILHGVLLISLMFMSVGLVCHTIGEDLAISIRVQGAMGALIVNTFVAFAFAGICSRWLHLIIGLPNLTLILIFIFSPVVDFQVAVAFLSNFIFIAILIMIRSFHQEYIRYDEFTARYLYKTQMEENLQLNEELKALATYDQMTGTYTRNAGLNLLDLQMKQAEREGVDLSIAYVDADHLKWVNDEFGHDAGDRYLQKIVNMIKDTIRHSDFIIRMGGDEFVVVFYNCPEDKAAEIIGSAHKLLKDSTCPFNCDFSYGTATSSDPYVDAYEALLKKGDLKMYEHKKTKRENIKKG